MFPWHRRVVITYQLVLTGDAPGDVWPPGEEGYQGGLLQAATDVGVVLHAGPRLPAWREEGGMKQRVSGLAYIIYACVMTDKLIVKREV